MTSPFWFFLLFCLALPGALGEGPRWTLPRLTLPNRRKSGQPPGWSSTETTDISTAKADLPPGPRQPEKSRWPRRDQDVFLLQRRLRLFPVVHTSQETQLKFMIEDKRNDKDHTQDHHPSLSRAYLQHENDHTKWELGRFNLYLMDGNVIDKRVDGIRTSFGKRRTPPDGPHCLRARPPETTTSIGKPAGSSREKNNGEN